MRKLPPIKHGEPDIYVALGIGSPKVAADTMHSFMKYTAQKYPIESKSEFIEHLSEAVLADEVLRRMVVLLATDFLEKSAKEMLTEDMIPKKSDKSPLHYALRVRFGLSPEEIEQTVSEMKEAVAGGEDPAELLASVGLGPELIRYLK